MRYLSLALLLLMLQPGLSTAADKSAELQALYNALNMLNQQQQAIYQQFQMVQEVRRIALPRYGYSPSMLPQFMGPPANYDEVVAAQKSAIRRDEDLSQQADQLLDKYNEIEEMKKPLQQKIYSLTLSK
jgi:type II secretory pathway pseudopilin PulG